ncbi:purine-cytosine permease-like protein [Acinetobacter calcoaceticus]|uniref:Purine-cytosine permease-like protein n=1 Tax=Acinetobacter calcoaceticus TaxID=471 RepID=A0A4R1XX58_ACICA|nr:purine-cytosine permease-like protein [Acinetobacter calcoaceticus]
MENSPLPKSEEKEIRLAINETLEDYTLRYAPHSFRRWSPRVVSITALGGIAYLADMSIGASISLTYGSVNAIWAILFAAVIIFLTGFPIGYYSARYNIDLDLITRGAGFGYVGSILTSLIYASYTFIFFAIEGAIMAQGLYMGLDVPLWAGYLISTIVVIPLVIYGMKALSQLQLWTTPIWLILMVAPVAYLIYQQPVLVEQFSAYTGTAGYAPGDTAAIMLAAGVCLSLIMQIGEQVDYLRFMPAKTKENNREWWISMIAAGPGWVGLAAIKQIIGAFLGFYLITKIPGVDSTEPVRQFNEVFYNMLPDWIALTLAVILVVLSQVKINVTNAYSGSLGWTSAYTRLTKHYPGRTVFVFINLAIALALMEGNMFAVLAGILGFYSNFAIAWVVVVATDISVNKYLLKLSPKRPEYRRGMLYDINPVGMVSFLAAAILSIAAFFGLLGQFLSSYSPLIALIVGFVLTPIMGLLTKGKYYIKHSHDGIDEPRYQPDGTPVATIYRCIICHEDYERPDVLYSIQHKGVICSLCTTLDKTHLKH